MRDIVLLNHSALVAELDEYGVGDKIEKVILDMKRQLMVGKYYPSEQITVRTEINGGEDVIVSIFIVTNAEELKDEADDVMNVQFYMGIVRNDMFVYRKS